MAATILVTEVYRGGDGRRLSGAVIFTATSRFTDVPAAAEVLPTPVRALVQNGRLSVALTATTGPDVDPPGWRWLVKEQLVGAPNRDPFEIALPYDGPPMVVLRDLAPVPDFDPVVYGPVFGTTYDGGVVE